MSNALKQRAAARALRLVQAAGATAVAHRLLGPRRLTVLAYHRVDDLARPAFRGYRGNVSATPATFAAQLAFIARYFNVVGLNDLSAAQAGQRPLPPYPLLITFDDGYRDNYTHAFPALRARGWPAVIFLTSGHIDGRRPFHWDLAAFCFARTRLDAANLPALGPAAWSNEAARRHTLWRWLTHLKALPDSALRRAVNALPDTLDVAVPGDAFEGLYLNSREVGEMAAADVAFGAHTCTHPILTRVPPRQARDEIAGSAAAITELLDRPVTAFAYPNGQDDDWNPATVAMVRAAGFRFAFTLQPGPSAAREWRAAPLTIRRVYIGAADTRSTFAAKLLGLPRLLNWPY